MKIYNIEINGIDLSNKTFSTLTKNLQEVYLIAEKMEKAAKELWWEDAEVVEISLYGEVTVPDEFVTDLKKKAKATEERGKEEATE